jgi:hypothetical protein
MAAASYITLDFLKKSYGVTDLLHPGLCTHLYDVHTMKDSLDDIFLLH